MDAALFDFDINALKNQDRLREECKKLTEKLIVRSGHGFGGVKAMAEESATPEQKKKFSIPFPKKEDKGAGKSPAKEADGAARLIVLNEEVYQACVETLDAKKGPVVREGPVEVLKGNGKMQKRFLRVTTTHVDCLEGEGSKTVVKSFPVIGVSPERVQPKASNQHLLELVNTSGKPLVLNIAENCNQWLLVILQVRILGVKKLYDLCPPFRNFMVSQPKDKEKEKVLMEEKLRKGTTAPTNQTGPDSELFKFAFLDYERVGACYSMATALHETYVADVDKILKRLEGAMEQKQALQKEIADMEEELTKAQSETQRAGRALSQTFGTVLTSVGTLHRSLQGTHEALKSEMSAKKEGTLSSDKLLAFRQALHILDTGLTVDGPLKRQLGALEMRDQRAGAELAALQSRKEQLALELDDAKKKKAALNDVMSVSGQLSETLSKASELASRSKSSDPRQWVQLCTASESASLDLVGRVALLEKGGSEEPSRPSKRAGSSVQEDNFFANMDENSAGQDESESSGGVQAEGDDHPVALVQRILAKPSGNLETAVLRTFTYFMKPVQLWEQINLTYCSGPSIGHSAAQVAEIEKKMAGIRFRTLNVLKKWVEIQKYHFVDDMQMLRLIKNFLSTARLIGHEKIANMIEAELLAPATPPEVQRVHAPPIFKDGFDRVESIAVLSHVTPEELARQLTLLDQKLYRKLQVREFLKLNFMKKPELAPNIRAFTAHFNVVASCVSSSILAVPAVTERSKVIQFWIKTLEHLRLLHNYESTLAVVAGMTSTPVNRLKNTWAIVPPEAVAYFEDCRNLMEKNFARLRLELDTAIPPAIPYLGAYQRDLVYLDESPTMKGESVNVSKLKSISQVLHNCLAFQDSNYWFQEIPEIQRLVTEMPTFSEDAAHAMSLELEPRINPEEAKRKSSTATKGTVVNKFALMKDEELPRLPTFPPPLTDKEDYKEYMQLRYEYKRRRIPLDGAVAFVNVSKTNEGGGFLKIKNDLEEEDDVDEDDPDMETREPKRIIVAPPLAKGDNTPTLSRQGSSAGRIPQLGSGGSGLPAPSVSPLPSPTNSGSKLGSSGSGATLTSIQSSSSPPTSPSSRKSEGGHKSHFGVPPSVPPKQLQVPIGSTHRRSLSSDANDPTTKEVKKIPLSSRRVAGGSSGTIPDVDTTSRGSGITKALPTPPPKKPVEEK